MPLELCLWISLLQGPKQHQLFSLSHPTSHKLLFTPLLSHHLLKIRAHTAGILQEQKIHLTSHCTAEKDCVSVECLPLPRTVAVGYQQHRPVTTSHNCHLTATTTYGSHWSPAEILSHRTFFTLLLWNWLQFRNTGRVNLQSKVYERGFHHMNVIAHYHQITKKKKEANYKVC